MKRLFASPIWRVAVILTTAILVLWASRFLLVTDYALSFFSSFEAPVLRPAAEVIRSIYLEGIAALLLILLVLVAAFVERSYLFLLRDRFRNISTAIRNFASGDYASRAIDSSNDEVSKLAHTFNSMADTVVKQMEEIKQADIKRKELIANIAHDLKTPLTSILGYLETIKLKEAKLSEIERAEFINTALRHTHNLTGLVEQLLDLGRFDSGQKSIDRSEVNLDETLKSVIEDYRPFAQKRDISITLETVGELPPLQADQALLKRAVSNLIENAVRYNSEGGSVHINLRLRKNELCFEVSDTGCGIASDEISRVGERFYRTDRARTSDANKGGTGLGLSIAKSIIEAHRGTLSIESTLGQGTTVSVAIPVGQERD